MWAGDLTWALLFGWWLAAACMPVLHHDAPCLTRYRLLDVVLSGLMFCCFQPRLGRLSWHLAGYYLFPFGKFVVKLRYVSSNEERSALLSRGHTSDARMVLTL
jgi:uncharacterized membrane protein YccF (DUF307 family)